MDVLEAHRLAFLTGLDFDLPDQYKSVKSILTLLNSYSGSDSDNDELLLVIDNLNEVVHFFEEKGQKTLALMLKSGYNMNQLETLADWLILPENERNHLMKNITITEVYKSILELIHSNTTYYVINYFFEFPIKDNIERMFSVISKEILKNKKKINNYKISEKLFLITKIVRTLSENGSITNSKKTSEIIIRRIGLKSQILVFTKILTPILVLIILSIPVLLILESNLPINNILTILVTASGFLSIIGVVLKIVYEYLTPKTLINTLLNEFESFKLSKIFLTKFLEIRKESTDELNFQNAFTYSNEYVKYIISKFFLTNRKMKHLDEIKPELLASKLLDGEKAEKTKKEINTIQKETKGSIEVNNSQDGSTAVKNENMVTETELSSSSEESPKSSSAFKILESNPLSNIAGIGAILFKILLIGDGGVGKTSLRERYIESAEPGQYLMSIGADFKLKMIELNENDKIKLQIWDLGGQPVYNAVRSIYYTGAKGAIVVFDKTRKSSFENVQIGWISEFKKYLKQKPVPMVIIGNKADLEEVNSITNEEGIKLAETTSKEYGEGVTPVKFIETSAKTGLNVKIAFEELVKLMVEEKQKT